MPDSLSTNLNCKIDSLIKKTGEIICYVEKQQEMPRAHLSTLGMILLGLFLILFLAAIVPVFSKRTFVDKYLIVSEDNKEDEREKKEKKRNYRWVAYWLLATAILFWAFKELGYIHNPKNFAFSHADLLLAVASIIAIVGAVWAVFARIDADKAFKKSQQTLDAIGSTFGFEEILNNDKLVEIINSIGISNTKINLFLGFPCIGYLFKDKTKFKNVPEVLFMDFNSKLGSLLIGLAAKRIANFQLNLAVFSQADSAALLTNAAGQYEPILLGEKDVLKEFYANIEELKKLNHDEIKIFEIQRNENLRFASIQLQDQPTHRSKAIVWIVRDLTSGVNKFDSAAFQSSDTKLISVLQTAFAS